MNNNNTHPLSEFNRNRTFVCPGDGTLSHEAVEAIDGLKKQGCIDEEVLLRTRVGVIDVLERAAKAASDMGGSNLEADVLAGNPYEYGFSIRIDLNQVDPSIAYAEQSHIERLLDVLNRFTTRSAAQISAAENPTINIPPIYNTFELNDDEVVAGAWVFVSGKNLSEWHRGFVLWGGELNQLLPKVTAAYLKKHKQKHR